MTAMKGESFANASYTLYARHAAASGQRALARLFAGSAQVELREHFAAESRLAGLVRSSRANLHAAIAGETHEGTTMYPRFAAQARKAGDRAAAKVFSTAGHEELSHARQFKAARLSASPDRPERGYRSERTHEVLARRGAVTTAQAPSGRQDPRSTAIPRDPKA